MGVVNWEVGGVNSEAGVINWEVGGVIWVAGVNWEVGEGELGSGRG